MARGREPDTSQVQAVRDAAAVLTSLVRHALGFGEDVVQSITDSCKDVDAILGKREIVLAVVGPAAGRRALLCHLLERVFSAAGGRADKLARIRSADSYDFAARFQDGTVMRFGQAMPDREQSFEQSIRQAEHQSLESEDARQKLTAQVEAMRQEVSQLETNIRDLERQIDGATWHVAETLDAVRAEEWHVSEIERVAPRVPASLATAPPLWAFWRWVWRAFVAPKWRTPLAALKANREQADFARKHVQLREQAAREAEAERAALGQRHAAEIARLEEIYASLATIEVELTDEKATASSRARLERLRTERERYGAERRGEFFAALRDLDVGPRGAALVELDVACPIELLPSGITLAFVDAAPDDADGFVYVESNVRTPERGSGSIANVTELATRIPRVLSLAERGTLLTTDPPLQEIASHHRSVLAGRVALGLRACLERIATAQARAEKAHQDHIVSLENQRIPDAAQFRTRQLTRAEKAIEDGAEQVLRSAQELARTKFDALHADWTGRLNACETKRQVDACVKAVDAEAGTRIGELLDHVAAHVGDELARTGKSLEHWVLDELKERLVIAQRARASSLVPDEQYGLKRRSLPPNAADAVVGSIILPSLGTTVGTGFFGQLFKSKDSRRRDAILRVETWIDGSRQKVEAQLSGKRAELGRAIYSSLDETLDRALLRMNDSFLRLISIEKHAIESERRRLADLLKNRGALEEHAERMKKVIAAASFDAN